MLSGLYDGLFWLCLALTSLVLPVYVLNLTNYGAAAQARVFERRAAARERRIVDAARTHARGPLRADLDKAMKRCVTRERQLAGLKESSFIKGMLGPLASFLAAFFLSIAGRAYTDDLGSLFWVLPVALLGVGLFLVVSCLVTTQRILYGTKQEWELNAVWETRIRSGEPAAAEFTLHNRRGAALKEVQLALFIPPTWACYSVSPTGAVHRGGNHRPTYVLPNNDPEMPGYKAILSANPWTVKQGLRFAYSFKGLHCETPGQHKLYLLATSEQGPLEFVEKTVEIVP